MMVGVLCIMVVYLVVCLINESILCPSDPSKLLLYIIFNLPNQTLVIAVLIHLE